MIDTKILPGETDYAYRRAYRNKRTGQLASLTSSFS
jgi:hypothetical protein